MFEQCTANMNFVRDITAERIGSLSFTNMLCWLLHRKRRHRTESVGAAKKYFLFSRVLQSAFNIRRRKKAWVLSRNKNICLSVVEVE